MNTNPTKSILETLGLLIMMSTLGACSSGDRSWNPADHEPPASITAENLPFYEGCMERCKSQGEICGDGSTESGCSFSCSFGIALKKGCDAQYIANEDCLDAVDECFEENQEKHCVEERQSLGDCFAANVNSQ